MQDQTSDASLELDALEFSHDRPLASVGFHEPGDPSNSYSVSPNLYDASTTHLFSSRLWPPKAARGRSERCMNDDALRHDGWCITAVTNSNSAAAENSVLNALSTVGERRCGHQLSAHPSGCAFTMLIRS